MFQFFQTLLASSQLNEVCQSHRALLLPERRTSTSRSDISNPQGRRWKCQCQERERVWKKTGTETDSVREMERVRRNRRNEKTDWHNVSISQTHFQRGDRFTWVSTPSPIYYPPYCSEKYLVDRQLHGVNIATNVSGAESKCTGLKQVQDGHARPYSWVTH